MPRARTIHAEEREEAITLVPSDDVPPQGDSSEQWEEFEQFRDTGEGGSAGIFVWCYRIPTDNAGNPMSNVETELLFTSPIDVYTLPQIFDRVKREYMPRGLGREMIRLQVRREKTRGVLWQKVFRIVKGARDDGDSPSAPAADPNAGAIGQLAHAMSQAIERQNQMIARLFEAQRSQPQRDAFADSERIVAMITGLAGVLAKPGASGPAANSMADMLTAFREIKKLSRELSDEAPRGDGDDGNSIPKMLEAGKPYVEMLTAMIQRAPTAPAPGVRRLPPSRPQLKPQAQPLGGTTPAREPPPVTAPQAQGNDPMLLKLAEHVSDICTLIEQGKAEPEGIARLILDAVPEEMDEKFYGIVSDEHWLTKLKAVEPRVEQHAEFFGKVRAVIMAEFDGDGGEPAATG